MKLLRTILLAGFLGLMSVASQQVSQASAMQPPKFTLTDLGSVDSQANPYTSPTGYSMQGVYSSDIYKPGYRIGWTFTKDSSTANLLPDNMANDEKIPGYNLRGYSSSGVVFGDDLNTGSSFFFNTNTGDFGNFKGSGIYSRGITSMNSSGQALGLTWTTNYDKNGIRMDWNIPTYYNSLMSDPVLLQDLVSTSLGTWLLNDGAGINDNGQIFGSMINMTTQQMDYYRLDPVTVPEPSTLLVLSIGSVLFIARNRIRR
jgi:hypothetical protein